MSDEQRQAALQQLKARKQKEQLNKATTSTPPERKNIRYNDLEEVRVTLANSPKPWTDEELSKIKTYSVQQMNGADIIKLGQDVFRRIENETFTTSDVDILLALAVSLFEPGGSTANPTYILTPPPDKIGTKFKNVDVEASDTRAAESLEIAKQLERFRARYKTLTDDAEKGKLEAVMKKLEEKIASGGGTTTAADPAITASSSSAPPRSEITVAATSEMFLYPFLAAYVLRLYGKTPEAWSERLELAKKRAATWYDLSGSVAEGILVSPKQAANVREAMARKPEICSTWVLWCSYTENNSSNMSVAASGMIKYLATQMFSYTGMHAYSFIIQIQSETGVSFRTLLSELDCPATRAAVREIADIIRKHEITAAHTDRTTYFRYARVWDPGYFSSVQTSNCKMLAYVAAQVRKSLSSTGMSNPTDIFALKGLDAKIIATLDTVANNLYDIIIASTTQDEESGSIWKK